jgi:hypothetical protein
VVKRSLSVLVPVYIVIAGSLYGCATVSGEAEMTARAEKAAAEQLLDAASLRASIERDMQAGRDLHFPFYAPLHWALAERSLAESAEVSASGGDDAAIKKPLLVAAQCLEAATAVRQRTLSQHADLTDFFRHLQDVGADKAFPAQFAARTLETASLMALVDDGKHEKAEAEKTELLERLQALEAATIGFQQLHLTRTTLADVRERDGDKIARQTLQEAEKALAEAEAAVVRDPRDDDGITPLARQAYLAALHASAIVDESVSVRKTVKDADVDDETLEALLRRFEAQLDPVAQALALPSLRFMTVSDQAGMVAAQASLAGSGRREPLKEPVHTTRDYVADGELPENVPALPPEFLP